jgi:hypothetical protein
MPRAASRRKPRNKEPIVTRNGLTLAMVVATQYPNADEVGGRRKRKIEKNKGARALAKGLPCSMTTSSRPGPLIKLTNPRKRR